MANEQNLKPMKNGYDPRRNLRGVPADAIAARKLIRKIGAELVHFVDKDEDGKKIEYDLTRYEIMIRLMFGSKAPADRQNLLKALSPGLLKDEVEVTGKNGGAIEQKVTLLVEYVDKKPVINDDSTGS